MSKVHVSVVIPAHNEEKYVARCIRSIKNAADVFGGNVEIIVVCNRCTDKTAEIAESLGARVIFNEDRCIAKVRNTGIFALAVCENLIAKRFSFPAHISHDLNRGYCAMKNNSITGEASRGLLR